MNISWYLGFDWKLISILLGGGIATYYSEGWIHWLFYTLLVITFAYIVTRFRLYMREPWRRLHDRSVILIRELIKGEYAGETAAERNIRICKELTCRLLKSPAAAEFLERELLADDERKKYYRQLVENYPAMFTKNLKPEKHDMALKNLFKDIEASTLDPNIIITFAIEKKYGELEAARYLLAIASGYAK